MLGKMFKMMKKGNKGFTLVELMVVVVIIGVLTAIAVPVYNSVTAKAKINAIAANLRIINGAISQYVTDTGTALTADDTVDSVFVPDYIQTSPNGNPKGVNYQFGLGVTDGEEDETGTIQGIANVTAEISGGGFTLDAGLYDLADVQAVINDVDESEEDD